MKTFTRFMTTLATCAAIVSSPAWADQPGADWISQEKAQEALKAAGYTQITKIGADDGHWEGEGLKQDGKTYEFHVDPHSGKITKDEIDR